MYKKTGDIKMKINVSNQETVHMNCCAVEHKGRMTSEEQYTVLTAAEGARQNHTDTLHCP
jgi:hypothetical protein